MKTARYTLLCAVSLAALSNVTDVAAAQDVATQDVRDERGEEGRTLDAVIVTATKRQETLQDVPVAVSVIGQAEIEQSGVVDLIDLQALVPSFRAEQLYSTTNTSFFIRGFGNGGGNTGLEPSVGVFIDGVYRSRSASAMSDLPMLERVEVLRGPQSTIFGKNASAGVVSVVTPKPNFVQKGYVEAGVSNYNGVHTKAFFTGPISDQVAFSLGGSYRKRDGYIDNLELGTKFSDTNRYALRGQLLYTPSDNLEFRVIGDVDEIDEACCALINAVEGPTGALVKALGGRIVTGPFDYQTAQNTDPENKVKNQGLSFHADLRLGDVKIESISAVRENRTNNSIDGDFSNLDIFSPLLTDLEIDSVSQEIRASSDYTGPLNWLVGAFYYDESLSQTDLFQHGEDSRAFFEALSGGTGLIGTLEYLSGNVPGTFYTPGTGSVTNYTQNNETLSIFGQLDFDLTDRLTITAGLSYMEDYKSLAIKQSNTDAFSQINLFTVNNGIIPAAFFSSAFQGATGLQATPQNIAFIESVAPGTTAAIQSGVNDALNGLSAFQFMPQLSDFPNGVEGGKTNDSNVDYTLRASYDVNDWLNVYASYATGYKASSFNLTTGTRPIPEDYLRLFANAEPGSVAVRLGAGSRFALPEESEAYEAGIKAKGALWEANLALFDQAIENFQATVFLGTSNALANAERQSVKGIEFDGTVSPVEGLTLRASGAYLDAVFDTYTASPEGGDISGTRPGNVSEFYGTLSGTYMWSIKDHDVFIRAEYQYESDVDTERGEGANPVNAILETGETRKRGVNSFSASAGLRVGEIDFTLWGRNLFNDEYPLQNTAAPLQAGSYNAYVNMPRTFGLNARWSF